MTLNGPLLIINGKCIDADTVESLLQHSHVSQAAAASANRHKQTGYRDDLPRQDTKAETRSTDVRQEIRTSMMTPERNSYGGAADTFKVVLTNWLKTLSLVGVSSGLSSREALREDLGRVSIAPLVSMPRFINLGISTETQHNRADENSAKGVRTSSDNRSDYQDEPSGVPLEMTVWFERNSNGLDQDVSSSFRGRFALHPEYALERIEVTGGLSTQQFVYGSGQRVRIEQNRSQVNRLLAFVRSTRSLSISTFD